MKLNILSFVLVLALIFSGQSVLAAEVTGSIGTNAGVSATAPDAPTGLTVSATSGTATSLSWTAVSGADSYNIYRQTNDSSWASAISIASSNTNSYSNTGLSGGVYFYRVKTVDNGVESVYSSTVSVSVDGAGSGSSSGGGGGGGGSSGGGGGGGGGASTTTTTSTTLTTAQQKVDGNNDGKIDVLDFNTLMVYFGTEADGIAADFDGNGKVDVFDFNLLMVNWSV